MGKYIFLGVVVLILFVPRILWNVWSRYRYSQWLKDFVSKPFVCPNCGHRFYTEQKIIHPLGENQALLKCPNCGKRDICGRPYDLDQN